MNNLVQKSNKTNLFILLIVLGTLYIYSGALTGPFIWDDEHFVSRNPAIKSFTMIPKYFVSKETFSMNGDMDIYRPLRNISYLIDYKIIGLNPAGFHIVNLLLHIQNIFMVAYLVRLITGSLFISMVSSALFAFHPVQTEAVSWIKGRDDLLCTFFYLSALALYIKYSKGTDKKSYIYYWGSIVSFALALFSKEMAVTFPLIILLYNLHFSKSDAGPSKTFYRPYLYVLLLYLLLRTIVIGRVAQTGYWGGSFLATFYTNWTGIVYYLKLLFFPVNLCADYATFPVRTSPFDPYVIGAMAVILFLVWLAFSSFKKRQFMLSFSISWFFILLLPVSNIIPIEAIIAERFLYLPSIGIYVGVATLLAYLCEGLRKKSLFAFKTGALIIIVVLFAFFPSITVDRNHVWVDQHLFWSDVADKSPENGRAWHNIAVIYQRQGNLPEAISLYQKALMMEYHSPETHYQLGRIYRGLGEEEKALPEFFEALKHDPENAKIHYEIGSLMSKKGWYPEAIFQYKKALENDPDHEDALFDLGILYMRQKDYTLAATQFRKLLLLVPGNKMADGFLKYCESTKREG